MVGFGRRGFLTALLGAGAISGRAMADIALHGELHETVEARVDAGAHLQRIENLFVDADHGRLVSVSTDGTVRFWDSGTGKSQRVIWLPVSGGDRVQKSGMSRSGALLGVCTYSSNASQLLLFRNDDAPEIHLMPNAVSAVAFARDDKSVAVATQETVTVYALPDFRPVFQDKFADVVWAIDFDARGAMAVGSFAGELRLYGPNHQLIATGNAKAGDEITDLRFSPNGTLIALGFNSGDGNEVLRVPTMQSAGVLPPPAGNSPDEFARVSWIDDNTLLTSASESTSTAGGRSRYSVVERTIAPMGESVGDPRVKLSATGDLLTLAAVTGTDSFAVGLWNGDLFRANGSGTIWRSAAGKIYFDEEDADGLLTSDDGAIVALASPNPARAFRLDLFSGRLMEGGETGSLHPPLRQSPKLKIAKDDDFRINGIKAPLLRWESVSSWAIDPINADVFLATRFHLRQCSRNADLVWSIDPGAEAWAVTVTNDRRFVIATLGDGSIRWFERHSGQLVLSVFVHQDLRRWVAWAPGGYFTGSENAAAMLKGFKGVPYRADPVTPMDQATFERDFHRPDLLTRLFAGPK